MKGFKVYTQKKYLNRNILDSYNFNIWFKKVNFTNIQKKLLCYGFLSMKNLHMKNDAFVHNFYKNCKSYILRLSMGKHSEFLKFEPKNYYIWRAALGNISKKTNKCPPYYKHLNTGSLRMIFSVLQIHGLC